jgi:hypothetical protein
MNRTGIIFPHQLFEQNILVSKYFTKSENLGIAQKIKTRKYRTEKFVGRTKFYVFLQ